MAEDLIIASGSKAEKYEQLLPQIHALIGSETDAIANLANVAAALKETFGFFWVGFYLVKTEELVLGPFQGKPACIRIPMQKGVCGTAAYARKTIIVDDVNEFPGHIACDIDSRSEIVIPLEYKGRLLGVLDIDSPKPARFTEQDAIVLQQLCSILIDNCSWPEP